MRRIVLPLAASLAIVTLGACSSSYHPEYHPVTVSNVSYPVMVNNGGSGAEPTPVFVVPAVPMAAAPAVPLPEQPPPDFFARP